MQLPNWPYDLGNNPAYLHILSDYARKIDFWEVNELRRLYGHEVLNALTRHEDLFYIEERDELVVPAFTIYTSPASLVLRVVSTDIRAFTELQHLVFPSGAQSRQRLKHILTFLWNFNQLQCFALPCSSHTYIALEGFSEVEDDIDFYYQHCNNLELRFRYQMEPMAPDPTAHIKV